MNCMRNMLKSFLVLTLVFGVSGCSSFLTEQGPLYSTLVNGETSVGGIVGYKYSGSVRGNVGFLYKTPECAKMIEKVRVAKKNPRGFIFIMAEMVVFGLGFYDMALVRAEVENSKITVPLAKYESSEKVLCGERMPAANEDIVIFVRPAIEGGEQPKTFLRLASTDENGIIDFNKIFPNETRVLNLTAWLASNESRAVSFQFIPGI